MILGRKVQLVPTQEQQNLDPGLFVPVPKEAKKSYLIQLQRTKMPIGEISYIQDAVTKEKAEIVLEIRPFYRGQGLGEDALFHLIDHLLVLQGFQVLVLFVAVDNQRALNLYKKLSFTQARLIHYGAFDEATNRLVDLLEMQLELPAWLERRKRYPFKK